MDIIYKITSPSGKVYIGRTDDFEQRMIQHKSCAKRGKKNSLYKAIRKYGWDNMIKEIIVEVEHDKAQIIEEELILLNDSVKKGYNDTYNGGGGDNWKGRRDTDEYMEWIQTMTKMNQSNKMHGKHHTDDTKLLQKEKAKGRYSLEWFIERYGEEDGTIQYNERCIWLKNRKMNKDESGRFVKKPNNN